MTAQIALGFPLDDIIDGVIIPASEVSMVVTLFCTILIPFEITFVVVLAVGVFFL
jgi:hypothetical protein